MNYQVAIPSYRRADVVCSRSIPTLLQLGVTPSRITVFVADEQDEEVYRKALPKGVKLVRGVPGLIHQRRFYNQHYKKGTPLLNVDDDLFALKTMNNAGKKLIDTAELGWSMDEIVKYAFAVCARHGARLWGISAVENHFYMKPSTSVGLRYVCGIFHGSYAGDDALCDDRRALVSSGEDFETTIRSYKQNGAVVRLDWLCPRTKYFAPGGMQAELGGNNEARQKDHTAELVRIAERHPKHASIYQKAGGVTNIKLRVLPSVTDSAPLPYPLP